MNARSDLFDLLRTLDMTTPLIYNAAAAAGIATHLGYFIRGEHHLYGTKYIQIFLATFLATVVFIVRVDNGSIREALGQAFTLAGCYLGGLYASLLVYRGLYHPLRKFPGPFGNRFGNLWFSMQLGNADAYKKVFDLHKKYGDFVRIGSSDLSIIHPKAVSAIYGPGTKCGRSAFYNGDPLPSMISCRDRVAHDKRRRVWSPAFSDKALRGYAQRITKYDNQLFDRISVCSSQGEPVNVSKVFNYYSFDVMGDLSFGKPFDMLKDNKEHWAVSLMNEGLEALAFLFPIWLFRVLVSIPGLLKDHYRIVLFCNDQLDERMKTTVDTPDIMSTLLEPHKDSPPTGSDLLMLQGDSRLIVIAGSDTTAATLTHIFYHIAKDPEEITKLRQEIAPTIDSSGQIVHQKLQHLDHLNGSINETLRLHPPVPTVIPRLTPPEGIEIGDTHVPGDITVWCPQWAMARSENIYTNAEDFVPERWYSKPDMVKEKSAFAPFREGPYGCIGKPLALMQIRSIVAKLIMGFDVSFAPGEDGTNLMEKTRDHFTLGLADLNLVFKEAMRNGAVGD